MKQDTADADEALPHNYKDFPDGSLLRVVFHNFLTYEHTSFLPTANLNMILGHNGSGKSSIICGICLACGGSPKSLGRSEKLTEYIRHGCTEGYVEIAIADAVKGPQSIRLTIRVGKAPEYRLNNSHTTQHELVKLRKEYNIQIDNPCAFLAQDKVKSFSEQSAIELLRNTEKAASESLNNQHEKLIEQRQDSSTIEEKCTTSEKNIKQLESEIQKLQPFVENYRKKLALQSKLRLLEKKLKMLEFEAADKEYQEELKRMDEAMVEYREVEAQIQTCSESIKIFDDRIRHEKSHVARLSRNADELLTKVHQCVDKKRMENVLERAKMKLESAKSAFERHDRDLAQAKKSIEVAKSKLEEADEDVVGYETFNETLKKAEHRFGQQEQENRQEEDAIQRTSYDVKKLEREKQDKESESRNNFNDRFRALQSFSSDAAKAYRFYQQNRQQFRGDIYVPILDMVLKYEESSKALENSVGVRDRCMFVCQFKEDERKINGKDNSWRINTSVVSKEQIRLDDIETSLPDELKRMGFKFMVSECFDAPSSLKQYLCNVAGLSRIPYGTADVERRIAEVSNELAQTRYQVFMTNGLRCQATTSRYSGEVIQTQSVMRDPYTWRDSCFRKSPYSRKDETDQIQMKIDDLRAKLDERAEALRQKRFAIQRDRDVLRSEQVHWKSKKQVQVKWQMELKQEQGKLRQLEKENIDISKAETEYAHAAKSASDQTKKMFKEAAKYQTECIALYHEMARRAVIDMLARHRISKITVELDSHREKLDDLKDVKRNAEITLKSALNVKKAASEALTKVCSLKHLDENRMESGEKRIFEKINKLFTESEIPDDLDAVHHEINAEKTRLLLAEESGEDGSIEHEQNQERFRNELVDEQNKYEKLVDNRQCLHDQLGNDIDTWRNEVEEMIEKINENYVQYFGKLGCRGEVSLEVPENSLDIEKYGIMITVCFRSGEKMKRLDNKVQSGGERSVATMLYLLALQQLCPVPFRCIDEINQGMDPTNERKVFDIMVGLWNGNDGALTKTQYFLLSPKLLHGLDMRENVNIVMVNSTLVDFHGKNFDTQAKLNASLAHLEINA
uniref:Structural maintenance of chromosomes protein 5 n=1 Tax=Caenorhabditis japonica TaxID=281687 RepID=A0A8R1DLC1_CAEJA